MSFRKYAKALRDGTIIKHNLPSKVNKDGKETKKST